jgi:predicted P-loop ATPase
MPVQTTTQTLIIAEGASANAKKWYNTVVSWPDFVNKFKEPKRTDETMAEYLALDRDGKTKAKDVGGFIGGLVKDERRTKDSIVHRQLIALDLDDAESPGLMWEMFCFKHNCAALAHSTHSSTEDKPRMRILVPVSEPLTPAQYGQVARKLGEDVGLHMVDDSTFEANRLMFWPSICKDGKYEFHANDGPWLDVKPLLAEVKQDELMEYTAKNDPGALPGTPGNFCRKYTVSEAITEFLPDVYHYQAPNRYRLTGTQTGGGLVVYGEDKWCYSHHTTDPIKQYGNGMVNAFDLVRIHKFISLDSGQKKGTPLRDLPSYAAMIEWIAQDKVCEVLNWADQLKVDKKGLPIGTINNMQSIMVNDEAVADKFHFDEFHDKLMVSGDFPWVGFIDRQSFSWNDTDDAGMRGFLEDKYSMVDIGKVHDAILLASVNNKIHPVRDYIKEQVWDNKLRVDSLLIDFLGAEDTNYVRTVTRKALIGAVARVFKPGCKHDHVLVLVGPQGCRKSTTIKKLGRDWYSDSLYNMQGKEAYELLQGNWLIEISEMAAARKADNEVIKQFLSKQTDNYRAAYARHAIDRPRQCAFIGSTNDQEFLKDTTGNRRFWPVQVEKVDIRKYEELTDEYIGQVWAEVYQAYLNKEEWYLNEHDETEARQVQERYTAVDNRTGLILEFLDRKVDPNHYNRVYNKLENELPGGEDDAIRSKTCSLEIWLEVLKGEVKDFTQAKSREITELMRSIKGWERNEHVDFGKRYGRVRGFVRV